MRLLVLALMLCTTRELAAAEIRIRPDHLAQALARAGPGDTFLLEAGIYRETIHLPASRPIRIQAAMGARVEIRGTDPLRARWKRFRGSIFRARVSRPVVQLFCDETLLTEARWPNRPKHDFWNRDTWARAGKGSRYGRIVDPALARTGIDWTGAVATLNVAHQFQTWTRTVLAHRAGEASFTYAKDLAGITRFADLTRPWEDDRYYLTGKLEALDSEGEWFYDKKTSMLYLWAPGGGDPGRHELETKVRAYGFTGDNVSGVELHGLRLFGCTFRLENCNACVIEDCHLRYPNVARRLADPEASELDKVETLIQGDGNAVLRSSFAWGPTVGLRMIGRRNRVEDCLLHDFCWDGALRTPLLFVGSRAKQAAEDRCIVSHCTLFNSGNAILNFRGRPGQIIEFNHVYRGVLACKDVALVYTGSPHTAGSEVRYNWVHGCRTEAFLTKPGLHGGLGIRGDDQTRNLTVHHNVVWDCGRDGIIVKGDCNLVANNTVFDIGTPTHPGNAIDLPTRPEPRKWWRDQFPLLRVQNAHSRIFNNLAPSITSNAKGRPFPPGPNFAANLAIDPPPLIDPAHFDFRPQRPSRLIDAGRPIAGITDGFAGEAPDVGACESGAKRWIPGITWDPEKVLGHRPRGYLAVR